MTLDFMTVEQQCLTRIVVFTLDGQRFALLLSSVERVIPIVEITPLPNAPDVIMGMVNVHGHVIPVADFRRRLGLPPRESALGDRLIIAKTRSRTLALAADDVAGVADRRPEDVVAVSEVAPGIRHVTGVVKLAGGLTLIHDIDGFLSLEEDEALDHALKKADNRV